MFFIHLCCNAPHIVSHGPQEETCCAATVLVLQMASINDVKGLQEHSLKLESCIEKF